jgi:endonuclease/exonuclease/phosphatase family metal-dependent hydrolase
LEEELDDVSNLRVLSYNVRYFGHATRGIASTRNAMKRIASAIARLDPLPDIVCLQEVETASFRSNVVHRRESPEDTQLSRLMVMLDEALVAEGRGDEGYDAYYFPAHAYRLGQKAQIYTTGLAILSHRDFDVHHHNSHKPEDITHRRIHAVSRLKQTRICAHMRCKDREGHVVDVFNTHLSLPTTLSRNFWTRPERMGYGPNQIEEAKNLIRFVEAERRSDRFFIAGDFNSLPGSPVYEHLTKQHGYCDPFAEVHRMSADELRKWPTAGFMQLRMHLDHIFTGPALRWIDFDETHAFGDRTAKFHGLSDHVPIIGRCSVAGQKDSQRPRGSSRPAISVRAPASSRAGSSRPPNERSVRGK